MKNALQKAHRRTFAKFRMGVAPLHIETGRYERIEEEKRECFNYGDAVESVGLPLISKVKRNMVFKDDPLYTELLF